MYFILILSFLLLFICSMMIFKKDIFNPACMLSLCFLFASIFGLNLYDYWRLEEFGGFTVLLFFTGASFFSIGCMISYIFLNNRVRGAKNLPKTNRDIISIPFRRMALINAVSTITMIVFLIFFLKTTSSGSLTSLITQFKEYRTSNSELPIVLNVLLKINSCLSFISLFIFINNIYYKKTTKSNYSSKIIIFPTIVHILISLLSSNRGEVLILFMGGVMFFCILVVKDRKSVTKAVKYIFKKCVLAISIVLFLFWGFMMFVNDFSSSSSDSNIIVYLSSYISGPFSSFDLYLKQGGLKCEWWGQETFSALNNNIYTIFNIGHHSTRFLEYRSTRFYSTTNIYSSFRRFYHDFGFSGVVILSLFQGLITSFVYYFAVSSRSKEGKINYSICIYCYFAYTIFYTLTDELFYSSNVSISGLIKIIIFTLSYYFVFNKNGVRIKRKVIQETSQIKNN